MFFLEVLLDNVRLALAASKVASEALYHLRLIPRAASANRIGLHILVEQLIRIQFGTVAWQEEYPYSVGVLVQPALQLCRPMDRVAVDNEVHSSLNLAQKPPEELQKYLSAKPLLEHHEMQTPSNAEIILHRKHFPVPAIT